MFDELKASISSLRERARSRRYLDREAKLARIAEIDVISAGPDFWNDHQRAQSLGREKTRLQKDIDAVDAPLNAIKEAAELLEMAELEGEEEFATEVAASVERIEQEISDLEFARMMSGENDRNDAIVEIHAGMGGTESQDWVQMLLRMYLMWCERRGFKVDVLDELAGEEAGLKSVAFQVSGDWAYGYLKAEGGVHRLVRISPFDANARRHTTFAGVSVLPDIEDT